MRVFLALAAAAAAVALAGTAAPSVAAAPVGGSTAAVAADPGGGCRTGDWFVIDYGPWIEIWECLHGRWRVTRATKSGTNLGIRWVPCS
jgi:hypothetical protein